MNRFKGSYDISIMAWLGFCFMDSWTTIEILRAQKRQNGEHNLNTAAKQKQK